MYVLVFLAEIVERYVEIKQNPSVFTLKVVPVSRILESMVLIVRAPYNNSLVLRRFQTKTILL
jgi:hypothetical protein